ncbi:MerR family DNA-binding transcriptional regulator, partial [Staphylococcus equorum]
MLKIKEVSEYFNLPSETIRYWEKVGIIPHISRNESGYREFNEEVVNW